MTLGDLLASADVSHLVTVSGARLPRAALGAGAVRLVPAPDETCAHLLAVASAELGHGVGACWDGEVLTLLSGAGGAVAGADGETSTTPPAAGHDGPAGRAGPGEDATVGGPWVPGQGVPLATPGDVLHAAEAARRGAAGQVRLRPDFALDAPLPPGRQSPPASPATFSRGTVLPRSARDLREIIDPLTALEEAPLTPARAAADLADVLPSEGLVIAEAGPVGLWVEQVMGAGPGGVRVPRGGGEVALAGALLAGRQGRTGVAVVATPPVGPAATLLHLASALDVSLVVEVWGRRGGLRSAADHRERLAAALRGHGVRVIEVPVDFTSTKLLADALDSHPDPAASCQSSSTG